jgi:hypothetical protein
MDREGVSVECGDMERSQSWGDRENSDCEREKERERQKDRETERQRETERDRERQRETERDREGESVCLGDGLGYLHDLDRIEMRQ